ncbi:MAG TPA: hypothetical protein VF782_10310 [Allosphingosinicella sp.]|jgi:hypothetical protein
MRPLLLALLALAACQPKAEPAPAPAPSSGEVAEAAPVTEPVPQALPRHWTGVFTMVEANGVNAGPRQFQLRLGLEAPNHFRAIRGCYTQQGFLEPRGGVWAVRQRGGIQVDEQCLARQVGLGRGSPEGLFQHREIALSPPGGELWIAEGDARWTYLPNPSAPPLPTPPPPPPVPGQGPGSSGGGISDSNLGAAEALYRHQIGNNASGGQRNVALLCLGAGPKPDRLSDPPARLLARFGGHKPPVKGVSHCRWNDIHWADRSTGAHAVVHYVTNLSCVSAARCTARGGYLEGNLSASGNRYELELRNGRWQVTADTMEWIS